MSFRERVALVTGAASGIGRAAAREFASRGANVCVVDIDGEGAVEVARELDADGHAAIAVETDVASAVSVEAMIERVCSTWGALHVIVNSAGIDRPTRLEDLSEDVYDRIQGVDQKGIYLVVRAARSLMIDSGGGAIVNISSVMAWYTAPGYVAYTSAKAAVIGMTRAMAVELGPVGIRVNAVCPGFIDTPIWQRNLDAMPFDEAQAFANRIRDLHPVGRRGRPEDVARACAYLCSDDAAFVTGAHLIVDGGVSTQLVSA